MENPFASFQYNGFESEDKKRNYDRKDNDDHISNKKLKQTIDLSQSPQRNFGTSVFNALKNHKEKTSLMTTVDAFQEYWKELEKTQLNFAYSVLVAGVLGSQTRDIVTIQATKDLILHCGGQLSPERILTLPQDELLNVIKRCNYCNMKSKYLLSLSKQLLEKPDNLKTLNGLLELNGVGPKIANLVLAVAYKQEEPAKSDVWTPRNDGGIVVDTHVHRTATRIGLVKTSNKSAEVTRIKLQQMFPSEQWNELSLLLIRHGQSICGSMPKCKQCILNQLNLCSSAKQFLQDKNEKNSKRKHDNNNNNNNNDNDNDNNNKDNTIIIDDDIDNNDDTINNKGNIIITEELLDYKDTVVNTTSADDNDKEYWDRFDF